MHRPLLKVIVNPVLRKLQFWTDRPWVITSICDRDESGKYYFKRYGFDRVKCLGPFVRKNCE